MALTVADLDGDAHLDLLASYSTGRTSVLAGNGNGTFGTPDDYGIGSAALGLFDLTGDGIADIVSGYSWGITSLRGNGNGTFGFAVAGDTPVDVTIADLDRDGNEDLVVVNRGSYPDYAGTVTVLLKNGDATFRTRTNYDMGSALYSSSVAVGDLNGDHFPDVVVSHTGQLSVRLGAGDGTLGPKSDYAVSGGEVVLADFDRDGHLDAATCDGRTVSVFLGSASGTLGPRADYEGCDEEVLPMCQAYDLAAGDLDRDGFPDLAVAASSTLAGFGYPAAAYFLRNQGDGTFTRSGGCGAGRAARTIALGDLDGDGWLDAVVPNYGDDWDYLSTVRVLLGIGTGGCRTSGVGVGIGPVWAALSDLDGDGILDLMAASVGGLQGRQLSVHAGLGNGSFGPGTSFPSGKGAVGDMNGDSSPDIVVLTGASNLGLLLNTTPGWPTPVLLSFFTASRLANGVELRWQFSESGGFVQTSIERGRDPVGPWTPMPGAPRESVGDMVWLDPSADPGHAYWYRVVATSSNGEVSYFGPVEVSGETIATEAGLASVTPNPGQDRVHVEFALTRGTHVRLEMLDVQGRPVARLVDRIMAAGRHQVTWPMVGTGKAPAGLYFVRLEMDGHRWARRFALVH